MIILKEHQRVRRNILLVDDDPSILELLGFFLQHSGFIVKTCKDGHSALDELLRNPYDLVILDISMPHLNGLKTLKLIRSNSKMKDLPVIMLTGSKNKEDVVAAKKNNVTDYIVKPPTREALLKRIELIMGGRPQFEEVQLEIDDPLSEGVFTLPIRLKSISKNGIILESSVPLNKDCILKIEHLGLFKKLRLNKHEYKITDCIAKENGTFEYIISFIGLEESEHERIREWIMSESYRQKNKMIAG
jgi:DNA-binding response OmpR family regulator